MGMERLASLICEKQEDRLTAYIVSNNTLEAIKLTEELRAKNISCEFDLTNKKFVKQLEKASKVAKYALILGEDEISSGTITVKNLDTSEQKTVQLNELDLV
jgi:histidyl-tRNA synthetase